MAILKGIKCQFSSHFALMAGADSDARSEVNTAFRPPRIKDLCDQADISVEELLLFCQCCWRHMSHYDKILFDLCELQLNWTQGVPHGMCHNCVKLRNKVEFLCFYEATVSATDVERETNRSIYSHEIICLKCARHLTYIEKQACVFNLEAFQKVRGSLRALCSMCRVF
uniref:Protein E6 n=1 Tax=Mops bat papillomavirus TaxID=3141892 RepID=A0AAU7E2J0_9PAPI